MASADSWRKTRMEDVGTVELVLVGRLFWMVGDSLLLLL